MPEPQLTSHTANATPPRPPRCRLHIALAFCVVVPVGLTFRHLRSTSPNFLTEYAGDTLWPLPFFLLFAFVRPTARTVPLAVAVLAVTLAIECSQLAHPDWLEYLRTHPVLGFLLGHSFLVSDLLCILVGTILCLPLDLLLRPAALPRHAPPP